MALTIWSCYITASVPVPVPDWALTEEYQRKLENTENRMIHLMYGLREGIPVEKMKMRQEMGVMAIND